MSEITYRELRAPDAQAIRDLRLSVLRTDPTTFSVTIKEEQEDSIDFLEQMLDKCHKAYDCAVFGAFDGRLVGMVGVSRMLGNLVRHKAPIWGLYVSLPYRRKGIGSSLLVKVVDFAKEIEGVESILLEVTSDARDAIQLCEGAGFRKTAVQRNALKLANRYLDSYRMELVVQLN